MEKCKLKILMENLKMKWEKFRTEYKKEKYFLLKFFPMLFLSIFLLLYLRVKNTAGSAFVMIILLLFFSLRPLYKKFRESKVYKIEAKIEIANPILYTVKSEYRTKVLQSITIIIAFYSFLISNKIYLNIETKIYSGTAALMLVYFLLNDYLDTIIAYETELKLKTSYKDSLLVSIVYIVLLLSYFVLVLFTIGHILFSSDILLVFEKIFNFLGIL